MKDNYNIKIDPPELSSEQIQQHQDFDALFAQFQASTPSVEETPPVDNTPVRAISSAGKKLSPVLVKYGIGALITIAASVLVVFMLQESVTNIDNQLVVPTEQIAEILELQAPMESLQKPFEELVVVDAEKGEVLEYNSGSKIIVPASAFVDEKGNAVTGKVEIKYREFNDHVDMFLAGVPKELDKHQNLQSVGMMEIHGYQDGKEVYLGMDKTLDVELKGHAITGLATNDLDVFVYSQQQDAWEYSAKDQVEVLAAATTPTETENASLRAAAEKNLASSKPIAPIQPGANSDRPVIDFDISLDDFPELAAYNQDVELMILSDNYTDEMAEQEWNGMKMTGLGNNKYELTLERYDGENLVTEVLEVYPVVAATADAQAEYERRLERYNIALVAWEKEVVAEMEQMSTEGAANSTEWVQLVNRFSVNRFGLWNCGKTVEMQENLEIAASFVDKTGKQIDVNQLFITNQEKQLYYFAPNSEDASKATLKYDVNASNVVWALTEDHMLLVANMDDSKPEGTQHTFLMEPVGIVNTAEAVRKALMF